MGLERGARIGTYTIVDLLGRGGMGEVYRAHDERLRRDVAVKVLPELLAADPERLARFEREAQLLAALNHPHIAHVYAVEHSAAGPALVLELVEGPTLADRIAAGPRPAAEALPIALQIADALEAAHERGIIHRDLKPANVKLTADGQVKVLDFGLAKALIQDPGLGPQDKSNSPTLTARATQLGMNLGTAAYVAPEQARGKSVDRRADIWAFGCVVYEMLTGQRAFAGEEVTDVLARVIEREPDLSALPAATPPAVRRLLTRCLHKDPKQRLRDIGEARIAIDAVLSGREEAAADAAPVAAGASRQKAALPWVVAGIAVAVAAASWLLARPAAPVAATERLHVEVGFPRDVEFFSTPSVSHDQRRVAFVGVREGIRQVYVRTLSQGQTNALPGTEGATSLVFGPDGDQMAVLMTDGRVMRANLQTGVVEDLGFTADILGGIEWTPDGFLLFGATTRLFSQPVSGGPAAEIAAIDTEAGETSLVRPVAAGEFVLFTVWRTAGDRSTSRIESVPRTGGARRLVVEGGEAVVAVTSDWLIYQREGGVFAAPFDATSPAVTGQAVRVTEEFLMNPTGSPAVDLAETGALVFAESRTFHGRLVWVSPDGIERVVDAPSRPYQNPRVSPDGTRILFSEFGAIWTFDLSRRTFTRVYEGQNTLTGFPLWSGDGGSVLFRTSDGIYMRRADGEGPLRLIPGTTRQDYPSSVSGDGRTLAFLRISPDTSGDLILAPLVGEGEARTIVATRAYEGGPQISPDGEWLAYVSNETGAWEVFLRTIDGPDGKWTVSSSGGLHPLWSRDGRTLYYRSGQRMYAVTVETSPAVHLGTPRLLFDRRYSFGPNLTVPNYSLSSDGGDVLMVREEGSGGHLSLILNWLQNVAR